MINKSDYKCEYIKINGIDQFLMTYPSSNLESPVLLFVHGGPGMAESVFSHAFTTDLKDLYTVVYWDQRGAGKTLTRNKNMYPSMDELLSDFSSVVKYLKETYHKDKIVILGHSFGSFLSSIYVLNNPDDVLYYIGAGQVINIVDNEKVGYDKLKELIIQSNNQKDLDKLNKIGTYPENQYDKVMIKKIQNIRILQGKYKIGMNFMPIIKTLLKSPVFKLSDIGSLIKGMSNNIPLWDYMYVHGLNEEATNYKVPVYYICGDNDFQAPNTIASEYFKQIVTPKKKLIMIKNAGHFMMLDQPQAFAEALKEIETEEKKLTKILN